MEDSDLEEGVEIQTNFIENIFSEHITKQFLTCGNNGHPDRG